MAEGSARDAPNGRVSMLRQGSSPAENWRQRLDVQRFQLLSRSWGRLRHLPDRPVGAQQLRQLDVFEIVADIAPRILASMLDRALRRRD